MPSLWKAFCLLRMSDLTRCVIQGASVVFTCTCLTGINRLRPVVITSWKTRKRSSQHAQEENKVDQSMTLKYLPISDLMTFLGHLLLFHAFFWEVVVLWSDKPKGGKASGSSQNACMLVSAKSRIASFQVGFFTICLSRKWFLIDLTSRRLKSPATIKAQFGN